MTEVSIVILNFNGKKHLETFLPSVIKYSYPHEVVVADNGSTDDSVNFLKDKFAAVRLIELDHNYGYTGGYNQALSQIDASYYILLNSDVEVTSGWVEPLLTLAQSDRQISAIQPKILSYLHKDQFEYAGAAGGYIDWLGYPFCRGRIFGELERDEGQYGDTVEIFWATGACLFVRAADFNEAGGLDEDFFAHMEEIDLCWRLKNKGKKIYYTGKSEVYHLGGGTLSKSSPRKTYLNFRNGLEMLLKNISAKKLLVVFPIRVLLDLVAMIKFTIADGPSNGFAVLRAFASFVLRIGGTIRKRSTPLNSLKTAGLYRHSIVYARFVKGRKKFSDLSGLD